MDWSERTRCRALGVLLAGSAALLVGCGPIVRSIEADTDEGAELDSREDSGQGLSDSIKSTSLFDVVSPQILEIMPDVVVTEEIDENGQTTLLLDNGNSLLSVGCKCPLGATGICVGSFPKDGSPATCTGQCDDAGTFCTWVSDKVQTDLVLDESFGDLALDGALFD